MKTNVKVDVDELKQKSESFINEFKAFVRETMLWIWL